MNILYPDRILQFKLLEVRGSTKLYTINDNETDYVVNQIHITPTTGQIALRRLINEWIGEKRNPWCFVQNRISNHWNRNNLTIDALFWWKVYSVEPKILAFRCGAPYGFRVVASFDKILFMRQNGYDEEQFEAHKRDFYLKHPPWLDRFNRPFHDIDQNGKLVFWHD